MEKRLLLFFGVTFLLVSLWPRLFPPAEPPPEVPVVPDVERPATPRVDESSSESSPVAPGENRALDEPGIVAPAGSTEAVAASVSRIEASAERSVVVETSLYRIEIVNRGARMSSMRLSEHNEGVGGGPYEMVGQVPTEHLDIRPLDVRVEDSKDATELVKALFDTDAPVGPIRVNDGETREVLFRWADGNGLEAEKRLRFIGGAYRVEVEISVRRRGDELAKSIVFGAGVGNEVAKGNYVGVDKGVVLERGEVRLFTVDDIEDDEAGGLSVTAAGVASHYFTAMMIPVRADGASYAASFETATIPTEDEKRPERDVITTLLDTSRRPAAFTLYLGPKKLERLQALAPGMEQIIEFGSWMRYPALLLRTALMAIYDYVGNYGWAIVLLTLLINVVLVPLKHYSFVSMRRMQKIAPQTQKIRERYKKVKPTDPRYQEMNKEIMALHKEHGVNPVSGCLPMLLMIPFFFAFYRLLMASIELRQAPFIFWVQDLSVYDPLFVLPVLMGGTQFAVQKMTPTASADPMQAKIMSFMPIMFTFILAWAPAGLVLYWFSNNLFSMAQQTATNRFLAERDEKAKASEQDVKSVKSVKKRKTKKGVPA